MMVRFRFQQRGLRGRSGRAVRQYARPQVEGLERRVVPTLYGSGLNSSFLALGDFNGDGAPDLAVTNRTASGTVSILLNDGAGAFPTVNSTVAVGGLPSSIRAADFNGDGILDLAVANSRSTSNSVSILLGNGSGGQGDGTFSNATGSPIAVGGAPRIVAVADFNGDGIWDLAVVNQTGNSVSILLGNGSGGQGDGTFTGAAGSPVAVGQMPLWVEAVDLDGDGNMDLAVANRDDNNLTLLRGNGTGQFTSAGTVAVGSQPISIAAADFTGDGKPDLAVANFASGNVSILRNDSTTGSIALTPLAPVAAGPNPQYVTAGLFSADGKADLIVADVDTANNAINNVVELRGNGDGTFRAANVLASFPSGSNPFAAALANLDNKAGLDLAVVLFGQGGSNPVTGGVDVVLGTAPVLTSGSAATFTAGTAGTTFTVTATGFLPPTLGVSGLLPANVTFVDNGDGTGTFSGTPAAGTGGQYLLTLTAANGVTPAASQAFTLTVNQAPAITSGNAATFTAGQAGTFTITTTGYPKATLSASGTLPNGVTLKDNGNGTATLSGTPVLNSGGTYLVTLAATNGVGSNATQAFTLKVNAPAPITPLTPTYFPADVFAPRPNADANTSFVHGLYQTVLGRAGDADGVAHWAGQLNSGVSRAAVIQAFVTSTERLGNLVDYAYRTVFDRLPDAAGRSFWVDCLRKGWTMPMLLGSLMASPEYTAGHGSNTAFVTGMYQDLLYRAPDAGGLASWVAVLDGGVPRAQVVQQFLASQEASENTVRGLYLSVLQREPDASGMAYYAGGLSGGSMTAEGVLASLLGSAEFYADATRAVP